MSIHIMSKAWKFQTKDHSLKLVLLKLADNASDEGFCWPSLTRIETETGLSRSSVCRKLNELETMGFITREKGCSRRSTRYVVKIPSSEAPPQPDSSHPVPKKGSAMVRLPSATMRLQPSGNSSGSKETKETPPIGSAYFLPEIPPSWRPKPGTKQQKLARLKVPQNYPSEAEFEEHLETEGLDNIAAYRGDLYVELCRQKWHHWNEDGQRWDRIVSWRRWIEGLDTKIGDAHTP